MVDMTALPLVGRSMRQFAWADAKATARTAVRAFAWTTGAVGLALFAAAVLNPSRVEPLTVVSAIATLVGALVYAALPGLVVATCAAVFRLAQGQDILSALGAQLKGNSSALGGLRIHEPSRPHCSGPSRAAPPGATQSTSPSAERLEHSAPQPHIDRRQPSRTQQRVERRQVPLPETVERGSRAT